MNIFIYATIINLKDFINKKELLFIYYYYLKLLKFLVFKIKELKFQDK